MAAAEPTGCRMDFPRKEVLHIAAGTALLGGMFLVAYRWPLYIGLFIGAFGLMAHELGHKVAGRYGCVNNVHFTVIPFGIVLGFATSLIIGHTLAAPGGVTVGGNASDRDKVVMGLAGPVTNFLLAGAFTALHVFVPVSVTVSGVSVPLFYAIALVNLYLGVFNLIPIPMFDGSHVIRMNALAWAVAFAGGVLVMILVWGDIGEYLVPLFRLSRGGVIDVGLTEIPIAPGLMLLSTKVVHYRNWLAHSVLDDRVKTLG